jgi:hypothetical protein
MSQTHPGHNRRHMQTGAICAFSYYEGIKSKGCHGVDSPKLAS